MRILPAVLESDVEALQEKVATVAADGRLERVQIDLLDGTLAPKLTVTPYDLINVDFGELKADFHIMTQDQLDYVWELAAQGETIPVHAVAGQLERMSEQEAFLQAVRERGWKAGLALDLETPLDSIDDGAWKLLDQVVLMAVPLGRQGQTFDEIVLEKLHELAQIEREYKIRPEVVVDGGVKTAELGQLDAHGVNSVAVGSFLWQGDFHTRLDELLAAAE